MKTSGFKVVVLGEAAQVVKNHANDIIQNGNPLNDKKMKKCSP
jgi:hypothetical protein